MRSRCRAPCGPPDRGVHGVRLSRRGVRRSRRQVSPDRRSRAPGASLPTADVSWQEGHMRVLAVLGVFMMAGVLVPIVFVVLAVLVDAAIVSVLAGRWGWSRAHTTYDHYIGHHPGAR